jgi:hypothetical protein
VIARPLVPQRAVDQDEVWRGPDRSNLASGRDADQQTAAGREKLLGDQHREWRTDSAADNTYLADAIEIEGEKLGVIAGPSLMDVTGAGPFEVAHDIAVRIEHADLGHGNERQLSLSARHPQQGFGPEDRRRGMFLLTHDGPIHVIDFPIHLATDQLVSTN